MVKSVVEWQFKVLIFAERLCEIWFDYKQVYKRSNSKSTTGYVRSVNSSLEDFVQDGFKARHKITYNMA
jgi:hypothetical protein